MARTRRLWFPLLAGLLVAGVLGVGGVGAAALEPRTVTASIMVPAAAFNPNTDDWDYINQGFNIAMNDGSGNFTAPLSFPVGVVNIKRITLYAYDSGAEKVCATLYRSRPPAGDEGLTGTVCTADSAADPQTAYTTAISPRQVNTAFHGPYLRVYLSSPSVYFYGVKITYSYDAGA